MGLFQIAHLTEVRIHPIPRCWTLQNLFRLRNQFTPIPPIPGISSHQFWNPSDTNPSPPISYHRPNQFRHGIPGITSHPHPHALTLKSFKQFRNGIPERNSGYWFEAGSIEFAGIRLRLVCVCGSVGLGVGASAMFIHSVPTHIHRILYTLFITNCTMGNV
jgi:hypothetical protein